MLPFGNFTKILNIHHKSTINHHESWITNSEWTLLETHLPTFQALSGRVYVNLLECMNQTRSNPTWIVTIFTFLGIFCGLHLSLSKCLAFRLSRVLPGENPWCLGPTSGASAAPGHLHHGWRWAGPLSPRGCGRTEARGAYKPPKSSHSPFFFSYMLHPLTIARPRHSRRKISCWWSSSGMRPRNSHIFVALACLGAAYLSCDTVSGHFFCLPCMHWRGTEPLSRASKHLLGRCLNPQNLYDLYADIILNDPKLRLEV